jgi:hypothetical protein
MPTILSDAEIDALIHEPKIMPVGLLPPTKLTERNKHRRKEYEVNNATGSGNEFVIMVRQNTLNMLDFSAILAYKMPGSNAVFRLRRYNGRHVHTNAIERTILNDFHIHQATERYQQRGLREDAFATITSGHSTFEGAIRCLLEDCGFNTPKEQFSLFTPSGSR